jgi:drug/metabolite transporter (DMT)-like permease
MAPATRLRVYLALTLGIVCIAFSAIFTRWAGVPGTVSAFYRVAIAAAVLALWNTSLFLTPAATATLLGNDAPIVVGLGALILFRERLEPVYWLGLALALVGIGVIAGRDVLTHSRPGTGDLLALTAGASYGVYLLATQRIRAHMDTLSSLWMASVTGAILLLAFDLATRQVLWGFRAQAYLALVSLGLVSQVIGWLAINYALGHLPAAIVSPTLLAQPLLTALLAVPLLGEALAPRQLIGGALALAGIYLVNTGQFKRP